MVAASPPVMTRALCHFDNAYWLPHVAMAGYCAKTNTQSNTAFRGFGGPQGMLVMEEILDRVVGGVENAAAQIGDGYVFGLMGWHERRI